VCGSDPLINLEKGNPISRPSLTPVELRIYSIHTFTLRIEVSGVNLTHRLWLCLVLPIVSYGRQKIMPTLLCTPIKAVSKVSVESTAQQILVQHSPKFLTTSVYYNL
jgi:hypothetical protein